jgi:WD repeat-containing protein 7
MIAFHPKSQRLAVGTHDGPIGIYDVRTSAKWRILEGHTGNVTSVCFDSKGEALASYSAVDLTIRTWKTGNSGFFSTIINGTGQQVKQYKLACLGSSITSPH